MTKKDDMADLRAAAGRFVEQHILEITKAVLTFHNKQIADPSVPSPEGSANGVLEMIREVRVRRIAEIRAKIAELEAELRGHIEEAAKWEGPGRRIPKPVVPKP